MNRQKGMIFLWLYKVEVGSNMDLTEKAMWGPGARKRKSRQSSLCLVLWHRLEKKILPWRAPPLDGEKIQYHETIAQGKM